MFEHPDAVLDDEQEVDSCQSRQTLPHAVKLREQVRVLVFMFVLAVTVVVASLRLEDKTEYGIFYELRQIPSTNSILLTQYIEH